MRRRRLDLDVHRGRWRARSRCGSCPPSPIAASIPATPRGAPYCARELRRRSPAPAPAGTWARKAGVNRSAGAAWPRSSATTRSACAREAPGSAACAAAGRADAEQEQKQQEPASRHPRLPFAQAKRNRTRAPPLRQQTIRESKPCRFRTRTSSSGSRGSSPAAIVSSNADGSDPSAGDVVDAIWPDYREDALSILRTLREPDAAMAAAGDVAIWERMIEAALAERRRGRPLYRPSAPEIRQKRIERRARAAARPIAISNARTGRIRPLVPARRACRRR